mmetsp:Transcript_13317/g.26163  ORF Transcript_13317/g.26163 Transcript_13317/m.26163 type:complete len:256 (+) Transcript_13317:133-900(+)
MALRGLLLPTTLCSPRPATTAGTSSTTLPAALLVPLFVVLALPLSFPPALILTAFFAPLSLPSIFAPFSLPSGIRSRYKARTRSETAGRCTRGNLGAIRRSFSTFLDYEVNELPLLGDANRNLNLLFGDHLLELLHREFRQFLRVHFGFSFVIPITPLVVFIIWQNLWLRNFIASGISSICLLVPFIAFLVLLAPRRISILVGPTTRIPAAPLVVGLRLFIRVTSSSLLSLLVRSPLPHIAVVLTGFSVLCLLPA